MHLHHNIIVSMVTYDLIGFFLSLSHPVSTTSKQCIWLLTGEKYDPRNRILRVILHACFLQNEKGERENSLEDNPDPGPEQRNTMSRMDIDRKWYFSISCFTF